MEHYMSLQILTAIIFMMKILLKLLTFFFQLAHCVLPISK